MSDVDGKIQETYGECKEEMDMSYKGVWGFSTLATTEAVSGTHREHPVTDRGRRMD